MGLSTSLGVILLLVSIVAIIFLGLIGDELIQIGNHKPDITFINQLLIFAIGGAIFGAAILIINLLILPQ